MSLWHAAALSVFRHAKDATPAKTTTRASTLTAIQQGTYAPAIANLRAMREVATAEAYTRAKGRLPAVTFGGTFAPTRGKQHLVQHSGIVHGDIDHLPDVQRVKQQLSPDPHTAYLFVSPSGDGLKLGVVMEPVASDDAYKHVWQTVATYYAQRYAVTWDPSGKDVCRLCFLSWDPTAWVHSQPRLFVVPPLTARQTAPSPAPAGSRMGICPFTGRVEGVQQALDAAVALIPRSIPGTRHRARAKAAYLLGGYVGAELLASDQAYAVLAAVVTQHSADPERALQTVRDCLEAGQRAPLTGDEWPRAASTSGPGHGLPFRTVRSPEVPPWPK